MNGIHWQTCLSEHTARISCSIFKSEQRSCDAVASLELHLRVSSESRISKFFLIKSSPTLFFGEEHGAAQEKSTHPTAGSQKHTSPWRELMSKTPDRRRRADPAKSEAQRGLWPGGPWPDQVRRAPGPSTSCPKAEGPLSVTATPQSPWGGRLKPTGSAAAGYTADLL